VWRLTARSRLAALALILLDNQSGNQPGCVLYLKLLRYNG
jgi:hypothetical protein